jgi:uncharacterized membrane protein
MLENIFGYIIIGLEVLGVLIIIIGVLKMLFIFGKCFVTKVAVSKLMTEIRIELSNYLILSLEIFIGRDIIETLLDPSISDIVILVVLVLLRTLLAFFLNYEITHMPKRKLHKVMDKKS